MAAAKRTNMKPEDRRNQLLDCAHNLFFSKGFEATPLSEILAETGISKGGFYHHFSSKEELMFGVFDRLTHQFGGAMQAIVNNTALPATDRLQTIINLQAETYRSMGMDSIIYSHRALMKNENAAQQTLMNRKITAVSIPILTQLFQDGQARGEFTFSNARAAAAFFMSISTSFDVAMSTAIEARGTDQADDASIQFMAVIQIQYDTTNMILGLPKDTIKFGWPDFIDVLMAHRLPDETGLG